MKISRLKEITLKDWPAKILSLALAIFIYVFHQFALLDTKSLTVDLAVTGSSDFIISNEIPKKIRVTLRGLSKDISPITDSDIDASIDISAYTTPGRYHVLIKTIPQDNALDADPLEISVLPLDVLVVLSRRMSKSVPILPELAGTTPDGYELSSQTINPTTVQIEGPDTIIKDISSVSTEEIDLSGRSGDFTKTVRLINPNPFTYIQGTETASFSANIASIKIVKDISNLKIAAENLSNDFSVVFVPEFANIRAEGTWTAIEAAESKTNLLIVDLSKIQKKGTYQLPIEINANGITSVELDPKMVSAEITDKEKEN
ncbi:MAG: hypothetical protein LBV52_00900 [Spirochaetaceae bacterium]|nr:hypothetical protein [Spirochaetaceae bacterium]